MSIDPHLEKRTQQVQPHTPSTSQASKKDSSNNSVKNSATNLNPKQSQPKNESQRKFSELLKEANTLLLQAKTIFPFDPFPDVLTIDPLKVTILHNTFFYSSWTESIPVVNITNVDVEESLVFATLRISFISYPTQEVIVKPLKKDIARHARDIIAGLMVAAKEHIDLEEIPTSNPDTIAQIGKAVSHE